MERFLGDLVEAQHAAGDEVAVIAHAHESSKSASDPPWLTRCPVWFQLLFAPISPTFPWHLARAIERHRPDVLHIHMPNMSAFWAMLLPAARRLPWVVHWQSDVEPSKLKRSLRWGYPHYGIFERALLEHCDCIIVTSPNYLESSKPLAPWRYKCHVVPLGVDPRRLPDIDPGDAQGLWHGSGLRVLAVGRLTYYKAFEVLVRAVAGETAMELAIAGDGEERPALERALDEARRPGNIRLLGRVDDLTIARLMASCDVFCLPSRERTESFGVVLIEAMRYAKPLVVSDLRGSGVTWVARAGENALLAPVDDPSAWREALRALAGDALLRQRLGHAGHARYAGELTIADVARRIRRVYALTLQRLAEDVPGEPEWSQPPIEGEQSGFAANRILVVIPALNESLCIGDVVTQARAHPGIDVLVVDDGSTDDTAAIALRSGAKVAHAPLWQGAWGGIQTGLRYAIRRGYRGVVTMDADGQHEPAYMPLLLDAAREADVVIAACASRGSRLRHIAWAYFRLLTGFSLDDLTSGFRFYNARACRLLAAEEATLLDYQDIGVLLLLRHANLRIAEVSVAMNPRRNGASRVFSSWWTVVRYMAETSLLCLARWNRAPRGRELRHEPELRHPLP